MNYTKEFDEINKILLESMKPSEELKRLIDREKLDSNLLIKINKLKNIDQNKKYHPEGSVLNHVFMVVDKASEYKRYSKNQQVFMWAALLHDIGKLTTTRIRKSKITSYNHDVEGEKIAFSLLDELTNDSEFKLKVSRLVRWHMQPLFYDKNLPFFKPKEMLNDVDYREITLLSLCDRLGRGELDKERAEEEINRIKSFEKFFREE